MVRIQEIMYKLLIHLWNIFGRLILETKKKKKIEKLVCNNGWDYLLNI